MNKRKFVKDLLSTVPILKLNQLYAENAEVIADAAVYGFRRINRDS